jgi:hypothetical protein
MRTSFINNMQRDIGMKDLWGTTITPPTSSGSSSSGGGSTLDTILKYAGSTTSGLANLWTAVSGGTVGPSTIVYTGGTSPNNPTGNNMIWYIGGGVLLLIILLFVLSKK